MARQRSDAEQQVADLLRTAKESLQISVAFLTRMDGTTQHLEVVESSVPFLFKEGATQKQKTTFCQAILDGKLPAVLPDVKQFPLAMSLPAARIPRIRSYVSVPVILSDGSLYGTFCAAGLTSDKGLTKRDKSLMDVLAHAAAVIIEPGIRSRERAEEIEQRIWPVMEAGGPIVVLQPIVDLATGVRVGAEALSRFPLDWAKAPDLVFGEAHSVGLGHELELLALAGAAEHVASVSGYVAMNISPSTLMTTAAAEFISRLPLDRILLELSEHDQVEPTTTGCSRRSSLPLRAQGMRLAIDDVGAGFSSLRHIVLTRPDVMKLDRTVVDGVSNGPGADAPWCSSLGRSSVTRWATTRVVAEGIETAADAASTARGRASTTARAGTSAGPGRSPSC